MMLLSVTFIFSAFSLLLAFQTPVVPSQVVANPSVATRVAPLPDDNYALGPGDQVLIRAVGIDEIETKPVLIDRRGNITLPVIGQIQAAGLTLEQLEAALSLRLEKVLVHPDVTVSLAELHSQPISVLGSVQNPGVHQLQGDKTLFEVLSLAGGLRSDAGYTVIITRQIEWGPIPLPTAVPDATGKFSIASVNVKSIMNATNPTENIHIKPNDVITVPRGEIIYVIGAVHKPGGFMLNDNQSLSALRILSLAEGLDRLAAGQRCKIMRKGTEIPLDLKQMLAGKIPDVPLKADDILFVPTSGAKAAGYRSLDVATAGASVLLYRIP